MKLVENVLVARDDYYLIAIIAGMRRPNRRGILYRVPTNTDEPRTKSSWELCTESTFTREDGLNVIPVTRLSGEH